MLLEVISRKGELACTIGDEKLTGNRAWVSHIIGTDLRWPAKEGRAWNTGNRKLVGNGI